MTDPSSPPAPMTAATLQQHRDDASDYTTPYSDGAAREAISDLLAHIDALTARVAELERHLATASKNVIEGADETLKCCAEVERLEAELAAARKVEDGEVASYALRLHTIANHALDPSPARDDLHHAADLLTRLSAALKEASRLAVKHAVQSFAFTGEDGAVDFGHYVCGECLAQNDSILVEHEPDCAIRALQTKDTTE